MKTIRALSFLKHVGAAAAAITCLVLLPSPAEGNEGPQFTYTTNADNTLTITGYTGPGGAVTIPTNINGLTVVSIGEMALYEYFDLTSVTIPNSVLSIGDWAFGYDDDLTSITFGNGLTDIEDYGLYGCWELAAIYFQGNAPSLGTGALGLPGEYDPATVYYLQGTTGWSNPFGGLPAVQEAESVFGYTTNAGGTTITITNYTGPAGAVIIPTNINGLTVTGIGDGEDSVFEGIDVTSVTISNSVTSIGGYAFESCTDLFSVTISGSVTNIGEYAFAYCISLTSVYFQGNAPSVGLDVFYDDSATVYYWLGTAGWSNTFAGLPTEAENPFTCSTNADNTLTITGYTGPGGAVTIPTNINGLTVTSIGDDAFQNDSSLTSVTIPNTVTSIGDSAFSGAGLTNVTIPNTVTSIGDSAFSGAGLTNVTIPNGVTSIGEWAFAFLHGPTNVAIPASVAYIGAAAFACPTLTAITVDTNNPFYSSTNGVLFDRNQSTLLEYPQGLGGSYTIPGSVNSIGDFAFVYITLTSITIPGSVTSIGDEAFWNCGLTNIMIPSSVTSIGLQAFAACFSMTAITVNADNPVYSSLNGVLFDKSQSTLVECPGGLSGSYTIPGSVTSIGDYAFYFCFHLTSVTIPDSVTNIGEMAFYDCTDLTNATMGNGVTSIGEGAFAACESLTSVTIPGSVTSTADYAFQYCTSLTSVTILNGVTSIGDYEFYGCSSLTSITIPGSLTSIGYQAFDYCSNLTSVTIPGNVASIAGGAFLNCYGLISVTIGNGVASIGEYAFAYCYSLTGVYFQGNAPTADSTVFESDTNATAYYLPGTTGWGVFSTDTDVTVVEEVVQNFNTLPLTTAGNWGVFGNGNTSTYGQTFTAPSPAFILDDWTFYLENTGATPQNFEFFLMAWNGTNATGPVLYQSGLETVTTSETSYTPFTVYPGVALTSGNQYVMFVSVSDPTDDLGLNGSVDGSLNLAGQGPYFDNGGPETSPLGGSFYYLDNGNTFSEVASDAWQNFWYSAGFTAYNADFSGSTQSQFIYTTNDDNTLTITGYTGSGWAVTIPTNINGLTVTGIGNGEEDYVFEDTGVTSVTIPDSVTSIGDVAFYYCPSLTSATIGNGVTSIGDYAFYDCEDLTSVTIGNGVTNIGDYAFDDCFSLSSVTIGTNVISIGDYAFSCENLTNVTIPASVTSIGDYAFYECYGLGSVYFEGNAPSADSTAFEEDPATAYYLPGTTGWEEFSENTGLPTAEGLQLTFINLHSFSVFPNGSDPLAGLVQGSDGNFYGTTSSGGTNGGGYGTIFEVTTNGVATVLYEFTGGSDGANPQAGLVLNTNDGNFYGTTYGGGDYGPGTVFQITPDGTFTSLYSFTGGDDGGNPRAALVLGGDGNLYGTTQYGGSNYNGTVFQITTDGTLTSLYSFTGGDDGANPEAALVLVQGGEENYFCGTTQYGGANGDGTIFLITTSGFLNPLYAFGSVKQTNVSSYLSTYHCGGTNFGIITNYYTNIIDVDGSSPNGLVLGLDGNLYGTTQYGGYNGSGTVFQFTTDDTLTTLYSFTGGSYGANPQAALVQGLDGIFYGTTQYGGDNGYGTVFNITTDGTLTGLYSFTGGYDGANPQAALAQASDGNFYGTATGGGVGIGSGGNGTVFEIATNGAFAAVYAFPGANDGQNANAMAHGSDGSFYGTTYSGGDNGYGTVFNITTDGTFTSLYSFTGGYDGGNPSAALVQGSDGNFYGTTENGGDNYDGDVFQIMPDGTLTSLYSFTGGNDGSGPQAALVQGGDGSFYGTTPSAGANGDGTVFKITSNGQFSTLYEFGSVEQVINVTSYTNVNYCGITNITYSTNYMALDGSSPNGLVLGFDGNFYGTTSGGGTYGNGTVFQITPNGSFTSLYSFTGGNDGSSPLTSLVQGGDGNFYGTTQYGGTYGYGNVFQIMINGTLTNLYSFTGDTDGSSPSSLLAGTDGNFYGTTQYGGNNYWGNVFQVMTNGTFNNLYSFTGGADGGSPFSALVQGSDGSLYGTTTYGAVGGHGDVFRLSGNGLPSPLPLITVQPANPPPTLTGLSAMFTIDALGGTPLSYLWQHNGVPLCAGVDFSGLDTGTLTVDAAAPGDAGTYSVVVSNSYGFTISSNAVLTLLSDTNAMEDFAAGTNYVTVGYYALANQSFANALALCPANATYNFFYAATELLSLPRQTAGSNFLDHIGLSSTGRDLIDWQARLTNAIPIGVNADEFTAQLRTNVLPAIIAAQNNLAQITATNFTVDLTADETHAGAVTVDWGDVQMLQAMCDTAQLLIYTINSWNVDVQLTTASNILANEGGIEALLTNYPSLLTTTSTADLPAAQGAFTNAISNYFAASQFIRNRSPGETFLFNLDANKMQAELKFRETLSNLLASLSGPVALTANPAYSVSAQAFFSGNFDLRSYLPQFQGDDFVWDTFPDTNFGGIVAGLTENQVGKHFVKHFESVLNLPGTSLTVLYNFTNFSGQTGVVQGPDGNLYGTMMAGGPYSGDVDIVGGLGYGSVFQVMTNGQFNTLYNFGTVQDTNGNPLDGASPNALVFGSDGNLYGTTASGGTNEGGTVFKITTSGQLTTLYSFYTEADQYAYGPAAALVQGTNGLFYGTTSQGGGGGAGTVFAISTNGAFTLLKSFPSQSFERFSNNYETIYPCGQTPVAPLVQGSDGNFYGTTPYGGILGTNIFYSPRLHGLETNVVSGYGTIFKITPSGRGSLLYTFGTVQDTNGNPLDGATPNGLVQGADGNLYGVTQFGGANDDSLGQNAFFTSYLLGDGTLFRISPTNAGSFTTLLSFDENFSDGYYPIGSLLPGPNGAFYGVTGAGGANQRGAVFIFNANGTATNLVWLTKSSGGYSGNARSITYNEIMNYGYPLPPPSILTPGLNGNFYGTTTDGGTNGSGTIYQLSLAELPSGCTPPPSGLVGWWPANGNALDIVGGNNGTLENGVTFAPGEVGQAFNFNSDSAMVLLGNPASLQLQNFTIEAWVQRGSTTIASSDESAVYGNALLFAYGHSGYGFGMAPNGNLIQTQIDVGQVVSTSGVTDTNWHHIAVTTSSGTVVFYIDGVGYPAGIFNPTYQFTPPAAIGGRGDNLNGNNNDSFLGAIDEMAIFNRALSSNEVASIYNAGSAGMCLNELPPVIVAQPTNQTVTAGNPVTFAVSATGTAPLNYQWLFNTTNLSDNAQITGSQSNVLTLTSVTISNAGTYQVVVSNVYGSANASATLTVNQATPIITWYPAPIIYGMALSSSQLDATTNVSGTLAYTPTFGAVLNAGTNTLSVIFTPTDTIDYSSVTDMVSLVVSPAFLTVAAGSASRLVGTTNPVFSGTITGVTNGDNITATYSTTATINSPAGTYPIVPSLVDPNNRQTNYTANLVNGILTVTNYPGAYTFITLAGMPQVPGTNDGTGSAARFNYPKLMAVDSAGNVYVTDQNNYTIRKVTPAGVATTLAGLAGVSGTNDGTGSAARFGLPWGVAVDSAGNLYVADFGNDTIRKVTPVGTNWVVTTLAGLAGNSGSADGTNNAARFYDPRGVTVDSATNLYVADCYNFTIRKVTPVGTNWVVTTLAGLAGNSGSADGTGSAARFDYPEGVAVDSTGNLYVTDNQNETIRKVTPVGSNWVVTTLAGLAGNYGSADGTGSAARFHDPTGVAVDTNGNVYVGDYSNDTIRKVTPVGTNWVVTTLGGWACHSGTNDGTGSAARFYNPSGVAVDSMGDVYVADSSNDTIREGYPNAGTLITFDDLTDNGVGTPITNGYHGLDWNSFYVLNTPDYETQNSGYITGTVSPPNVAYNASGDPASISSATSFTLTSGYFTAAWENGLSLQVVGLNGATTEYDNTYTLNTSGPLFITFPNLPITQAQFSTEQGSQFVLDNLEINGGSGRAFVQFTANPTNGLAPLPVQFTSPANDSAGNAITSWSWNFGGGVGTSTNQNPTCTYSNVGTFSPSLSVSNSLGALIVATGPSITVAQGTPVLTWNPSPITYGMALSSNQLDATPSVPGSFVYTPTNGTVITNVGTTNLTVVFTPYDTNDYTSVTDSVSLVVSPAPLTVTAASTNWLKGGGQAFPQVFTGTITGLTNGDIITATYGCYATSNSPPGTYPIVVTSLLDPETRLPYYTVTINDGTLTISEGVIVTSPANGQSFSAPATITFSATARAAGLALYTNSVLVASNSATTISTVLNSVPSGSYQLTARNGLYSDVVYVTVNKPGTTLINFDALDTSLGVMNDGALSSYLSGFGVTIGNVTFGTTLEAVTGLEAISQSSSLTNELPLPSSLPNLFTQVGSRQPVTFTLNFATNLQSFGFTRVELDTNGSSAISRPAWTASILDGSGDVLESVSEPLLLTNTNIPARTFTLVGSNIASVRFDSDSQGGTAAFAAVMLDDLLLSTNATSNPLSISLTPPAGSFTAPASIPLSPIVSDGFGPNFYVAFYSGPTLIGTNAGGASTFQWTNVLNGTYQLTAEVVDASGYELFSAPAVTVQVAVGGNAVVVNFDTLNASNAPVTNGPLAAYLAQYDGMRTNNSSPGTTVAVENQNYATLDGSVIPSSLPNLLTQIGSNGPVFFTVGFSNLLGQFSFTRPELVADPFVTLPAWQVQAFDALGQWLASTNEPQISSSTNVPAQTYTLTNPPYGGGIASVEFNSEGSGLTTFNAMLLDDFVLTTGSNLHPSVLITNLTNGEVLTDVTGISISAAATNGNGTITGVAFYYIYNGVTNLAGSAQSSPFTITWTPANGAYVLTAVATNINGLTSTSAPVSIAVDTVFAIVTEPTNQIVGVSNSATFSVTTSPTNGVSYQWLSNGIALSGATLSSYTVASTGAPGSFTYSVIASLGSQKLTSSNAILKVLGPPTISSPTSATTTNVAIGSNVTLTVSASDTATTNIYYQWQRNGQFLAGATSNSYTISNVQPSEAGDYQVLVANDVASQESPIFTVAVIFGNGVIYSNNTTFNSSQAINPTNGPVAGNNVNSPAQGELAFIATKPASNFLWFNWTADFNGVISLSTLGSTFDTLLGVYTGSPPNLTTIAEDDDSAGYFTSLVSFNCQSNTTYQIAVAGYNGATGNVVLYCPNFLMLNSNYLNVAEPAITQQPASQIVYAGSNVTLSVTAANANTYQWYFANAPVSGGNAATLVITNFPASAAGVYYVKAANGIGSVQSQPAAIELQNPTNTAGTPPNLVLDKFTDAVVLTAETTQNHFRPKDAGGDTAGYTLSQSFSTVGATKEEGEPNHAGQPGGASYWYSYRSPYAGSLRFDTTGSTFNTILAVYTSTSANATFQTLASAGSDYTTNYGQKVPSVTVPGVTASSKFYIAIDGYQGASGAALLNIYFTPANVTGAPTTNSQTVVAITSPANNYLTTNSTITIQGTITGSGASQLYATNVLVTVNTNAPVFATLGAAHYTGVFIQTNGGVEEMAQEFIDWSVANVPLVPGANVITAQSTNLGIVSVPVTRMVFQATSLPSPLDKSWLTLVPYPPGDGRITGQPNHANLEINKVYTVKAVPIGNWVFTNWSSTNSLIPLSNNASLSFLMSSNLSLQANFIPNPFTALAGVYNGLFSPTNGVTEASSGFFTATIPASSRGNYSARLLLDGGSYPFSGTFDLSLQAGKTVTRSGKTPLVVVLQLTNDQMTGNITNNDGSNSWNSILQANRAFNANSDPASNYAGRYTLIIPPGDSAPINEPGGYGYAILTNNPAGHVALSGRLGDGVAFSQSVPVATNGNIPLYASLYSRQGSLQGWLTLTNTTNTPAQTILGTNLSWIKIFSRAGLYPGGFTNTNITVLGSFYTNGGAGSSSLDLTNGRLIISNSNPADVLTYSNLAIGDDDKLVNTDPNNPSNQLKGVIARGTGVLTLTFRPTGADSDIVAKGVILQDNTATNATNAAGWFLDADQSGYFLLQQQ
jgi:uncharacterized repeat protein (TIGR03803 family)